MSFKLTIGRAALTDAEIYSNEAIAAFHVDPRRVDPEWLYYELPRAASRAVTDTAVKDSTLNKSKLRQLQIRLPRIGEQRRIAEILDKLDQAIRRTDEIIAKLKQIKQGLLHDLLTRGVDDNGELRDPERHPERFKESRLGLIPREWEIREVREVGELITGATPPSWDPRAWGDELPFITPAEITDEGTVLEADRAVSRRGSRY